VYPDAPRCPKCNGYALVHEAEPRFRAARYFECWFEVGRGRGYCARNKTHWSTGNMADTLESQPLTPRDQLRRAELLRKLEAAGLKLDDLRELLDYQEEIKKP